MNNHYCNKSWKNIINKECPECGQKIIIKGITVRKNGNIDK